MDEILASIRRILAEDSSGAATHLPPRLRGSGDVLELTEALNDDGSVRHIAPAVSVSSEVQTSIPSDGRIEPMPPRPGGPDAEPEPRLVSDAASDAVAASFAQLAGISSGDATGLALDAQVRETLRPMLQAWLDENLPALVERLVRAEIARVVGGIRPTAP